MGRWGGEGGAHSLSREDPACYMGAARLHG